VVGCGGDDVVCVGGAGEIGFGDVLLDQSAGFVLGHCYL
jgi:hypothetical protein